MTPEVAISLEINVLIDFHELCLGIILESPLHSQHGTGKTS